MNNITDEQLVRVLGGTPLGAGIVGAQVAPDRRLMSGLAAGLGATGGMTLGAGLGGAAGGAAGGIAGAGIGRLLDMHPEEIEALIGLGGITGGGLGGLAGGTLGSSMGAGLGYRGAQNGGRSGNTGGPPQKNDDDDTNNQQEKEGSAMSNQNNNAIAIGALQKLAEQNIDPAQFVQNAANSNDPGMRKVASAIVAYDDEVRRTEHAFAVGALEKLSEYNVSPAKFVQAASQSNNGTMQKIASTIVNLDRAVQGQQKHASVYQNLLSSAESLGKGIKNLNPLGESRRMARKMTQEGKHPLAEQATQHLNDITKQELREGIPAALAGTAALGTAGAGGAYAAGDSGTTGSGMKDLSNQYLGTNFDEMSRIQALLQGQ